MAKKKPGMPVSVVNLFAGFDDHMEAKEPGWKARQGAAQAERARRAEEYRASVIAKYGSEKAALALCKPGEALARATAHIARKVPYKFMNGTFPTDTLDGWCGSIHFEQKMPVSVVLAVSDAYPLPLTIAEARAEMEHWRLRTREIEAVLIDYGDEVLPLPCQARRDVVRELYEKGLPIRTLEDLHERLKLAAERGDIGDADRIVEALLPDFERLVMGWETPEAARDV